MSSIRYKLAMCVEQRLRSACESTQSDQSLLSVLRIIETLSTHRQPSEDSDVQSDPSLSCMDVSTHTFLSLCPSSKSAKIIRAMTCDLQKCGIFTSVDSD